MVDWRLVTEERLRIAERAVPPGGVEHAAILAEMGRRGIAPLPQPVAQASRSCSDATA